MGKKSDPVCILNTGLKAQKVKQGEKCYAVSINGPIYHYGRNTFALRAGTKIRGAERHGFDVPDSKLHPSLIFVWTLRSFFGRPAYIFKPLTQEEQRRGRFGIMIDEKVFQETQANLRATGRNLNLQPDVIEDLISQTFVVILRQKRTFTNVEHFKRTCTLIFKNLSIDEYRASLVRNEVPLDETALAVSPQSPDTELYEQEQVACVQTIVDSLSLEERLLWQRMEKRTPPKAIAQELGISVEAMKKRRIRLREKVRMLVEKRCELHELTPGETTDEPGLASDDSSEKPKK